MKPLSSLPLHSLKHLSPDHKQCLWEISETFLDVISASPEEFYSPRMRQMITVAKSIQQHTRSVPFAKITPTWEPHWKDGRIKCSFPSYNGQVPVLDLRARLDDFLKRMGKKTKNWKMFAANLDRETNIITFWAQDIALKKRNEAEHKKDLRGGERVKRVKKKVKVNTHIENLKAARSLSTKELIQLAQARGVTL